MSYIKLPDLPGLQALLAYSPQTAKPIGDLAELLLHDPSYSTLTPLEREMLAGYTSNENDCDYCIGVHGAMSEYLAGDNLDKVELSDKMNALLKLITVIKDPFLRHTSMEHAIEEAKALATDKEIHDAVLICSFMDMLNRYVDGLQTTKPDNEEYYTDRAPKFAKEGYANYDPET